MKNKRLKKDKIEIQDSDIKLENKRLKVKWDPLRLEYEEDLENQEER